MTYRTMISLLLLALLFASCSNLDKRPDDSLNFIIIFTDDQGYGDLSSYGHPSIKTPNIDQMALEGQKWTQFYAAAPVCTPSRAGLLTGRYPIRNGMSSPVKAVLFPNSSGGLPQDEITIPEVLKQKNYATGMVGKWHLGHLPEFLPTSQGFDYYYGIPYSNDMNSIGEWSSYRDSTDNPNYQANTNNYHVPLMENETIIEQPADQNTITRRYTEKAISYITDHQEEPFFLYLAHSLPHIPLFAHADFKGKSKQGLYGDVIEEIDWSVGEILQTLKDLSLDKNTIVIFTSDNGPWLSFQTHGGSAGPLRAGKGTTFEGGQRVPGIFWGPGNIKPGLINELGSSLDLIHTIAALSGTTIPQDRKMDSYDLSPVLSGTSDIGERKEFFYWSQGELFAARMGQWKIHLQQMDPIAYWKKVTLEAPEIYNLEADISEKYNRAEANPDLVARLLGFAKEHQADITNPLPDNLAGTIEE